jgi:hypothetical protein
VRIIEFDRREGKVVASGMSGRVARGGEKRMLPVT